MASAACGDDDDSGDNGGRRRRLSDSRGKSIKAGLVTDIGGLNDRSFNFLANKGLEEAEAKLGSDTACSTLEVERRLHPEPARRSPSRSTTSIIAVGFLMADATNTAASKFPNTKFAIVDFSATALKGKPKNVQGLLFKEQEAGYLAGYLAGLWAKDNNAEGRSPASAARRSRRSTITSRATRPAPRRPTRASRRSTATPRTSSTRRSARRSRSTRSRKGSKVVFQVAGGCGLGALDAAKEKGVQGIGVDADQSYLGPHILTGARRRSTWPCSDAIKSVQDGSSRAAPT